MINKIDCITFFQENFIFNIRYNILKNHIDKFIICESKYDHLGRVKKLNFNLKKFNSKKIEYIIYNKKFPMKNNPWQNQALQRDFILNELRKYKDEDYIFFSDPDEIPSPESLEKLKLKKKYGVFQQKFFNYKFNLYNPYESPWEGTRVTQNKNLKSIDYLRQKILIKNFKKPFWKFNVEKNIQVIKEGGWHFNNILSPKEISNKLKSFAHTEFAKKKFSNTKIIERKINNRIDLFERGHKYKIKKNLNFLPKYILDNLNHYNKFILR